MIEAIRRVLAIPELRTKIFFTLALLAVCRIGAYVPVPGINADVAIMMFKYATRGGQNLFQLVDIFSGGAFAQMTVFALGVMPYISASIILQVLITVVPIVAARNPRKPGPWPAQTLQDGPGWRHLLLALLQSSLYARYAMGMNQSHPGIIVSELLDVQIMGFSWLFYLAFTFTMTAGTLLLMWIGEQITEKGIGNGISIIIAVGILSSLPMTIGSVIKQLNMESQEPGQLTFSTLVVLCLMFVFIIIGTILVIQGQRRIPLQYARRIVGRHEVQGTNSHIPLKINYAGVIPVIFAASVLMFPATIGQFMGKNSWLGQMSSYLVPGTWVYLILYVFLILFFTYFWTATQFKPDQIASDMKKNGAFIPGIRQGKPTQDFLEQTMNRVTLAGAIFLAIIAILPTIVGRLMGVDARISQFFGGTSLLILVGVILDTTKQVESHLLMKRYDGFMKSGRLRGR